MLLKQYGMTALDLASSGGRHIETVDILLQVKVKLTMITCVVLFYMNSYHSQCIQVNMYHPMSTIYTHIYMCNV